MPNEEHFIAFSEEVGEELQGELKDISANIGEKVTWKPNDPTVVSRNCTLSGYAKFGGSVSNANIDFALLGACLDDEVVKLQKQCEKWLEAEENIKG